MIRGRGNILKILVDDAVVVQVLHTGQDRTGDKTSRCRQFYILSYNKTDELKCT